MNLENWKLKNPKFILDWDEVEKGMMIGYISILITIWDLFSLSVLYFICSYFNVPIEHRIADFGYSYSMIAGSIYGFLCILSIVLGSFLREASGRIKKVFMYIGMSVYAIGNIIVIHIFGELSTTSGIILAGAPIVGWVLFETRGVVITTIIGVIGVLCTYGLSLFGVTPYSPLVEEGYFSYNNICYIVALTMVITPHLASLLFLSHRAITHWKQREAKASHLAGLDSLTNIPNRRQFNQIFSNTITESMTLSSPVSLAVVDLDNFKKVNDRYGHSVGDKVLSSCVKIMQSGLRQTDTIGRLGGDEFIILMPNTNAKSASATAQRCLDRLRETPVKLKEGIFHITASVGVHTVDLSNMCHEEIDNLEELSYVRADKALYKAKRNGRNQVFSSHETIR